MKKILVTMMAFVLTIAAQGQVETVDTAQFVAVYGARLDFPAGVRGYGANTRNRLDADGRYLDSERLPLPTCHNDIPRRGVASLLHRGDTIVGRALAIAWPARADSSG
mgnify:CR=1 FL=1